MVRAAVIDRSTAAVSSPIRSCACFDAGRTRRARIAATPIPAEMPTTVTASSSGSIRIMPTTAPTTITAPVTSSNSPDVTTARSRVLSEPTRDSRSPVRRRSYSVIGNRSRCAANRRRDVSTIPSAVRDSR